MADKSTTSIPCVTSAQHPLNTPFRFVVDPSLQRMAKTLRMLGFDVLFDNFFTQNYLVFLAKSQDRVILTRSRHLVKHLASLNKHHDDAILPPIVRQHEESESVKQWMEMKRQMHLATRTQNTQIGAQEEEEEDEEELEADGSAVDQYHYRYYYIGQADFREQICQVVRFFKLCYDEKCAMTRCLSCNSVVETERDKEKIKHRVKPDILADFDVFRVCTGVHCGKVFYGKDSQLEHPNFTTAKKWALKYSYEDDNGKEHLQEHSVWEVPLFIPITGAMMIQQQSIRREL